MMKPTIPVRIPEEMLEKLKVVAASQHNTCNGIIRLAIDRFLQSMESPRQGEKSSDSDPEPMLSH